METTEPDKQPASDVKYMLVVSGLLMGIVILLGVLWMRERRNVASLNGQLTTLSAQLRIAGQGAITGQLSGNDMARLFAGRQVPQARAIHREDLPAETVTWNGLPRTILRVSASAGERIGLRPGDVVLVAQPPSPAPTTLPAKPTGTQPSTQPRG